MSLLIDLSCYRLPLRVTIKSSILMYVTVTIHFIHLIANGTKQNKTRRGAVPAAVAVAVRANGLSQFFFSLGADVLL